MTKRQLHKSNILSNAFKYRGSVPLVCSAMTSNFLIWEALSLLAYHSVHYEHVIDSFHAVEHNNMATKIFGAAIFLWFLQFKSTLGIGYPPVNSPISNYSKDENTTVYTVHQNETLRVSMKRISKDFEQILYKDGKQIFGLDRTNKTVYINDSGSDQDQLGKIQKYFHMKILNESHVQVIIYCETNFVEGNYIVQYNGVGLLDEPHPLRFSVKFAESLPLLRPSPSTQNYITDSLPSTSPSASFFTQSQSLAPLTTQIATTSANGSTGTDESALSSIWIAVGIGCPALVLALLVAFLVCKKRTSRSRIKSSGDTSSTELTNTSVTHQQQE